jgi:hypothetical protein
MRMRLDLLAAAVAAAAALHLAAVLVARRAPLLGTGRFARAASDLLDDPEIGKVSPRDPVRVTLGVAERVAVAAPGARAALDPLTVRTPPDLGAEWPDTGPRLDAARGLFLPPKDFAADARGPLRVPAAAGGVPSWADREVTKLALPSAADVVMRRLPARFFPRASLAVAAETARPAPESLRGGLEFPAPPASPGMPPGLPEPRRAVTMPDISVDLLEVSR